jgi:hypothetical protein
MIVGSPHQAARGGGVVGNAAARQCGLEPRQLARAQAGADRCGLARAGVVGPAQRVVDRPGRDTEAADKSGGRGALGAGLDDLAALVVGQFAMVAHVKFTFLFLANFLQAPRLPASAEAGQGLGVHFGGFAWWDGVPNARCGKRDACSAAQQARRKRRDAGCRGRGAGGARRDALSVKRDARDAMRGAFCGSAPLIPQAPRRAAGHRSPAPPPPAPSPAAR